MTNSSSHTTSGSRNPVTYQQRTSLEKSILRKLYFTHADDKALYYDVIIGIPDASTSYVIELRITPDGKITKKLR